MNIEDRAHEILLKMLEGINPMQLEKPTRDGLAYDAFELAEAMQAEAEKHKDKSSNDFEVDWSQAPLNANYWSKTAWGKARWHSAHEKTPRNCGAAFSCENSLEWDAPSFNYRGDWKDSLRKRP